MLPRKYRLSDDVQIQKVKKEGRLYNQKDVSVLVSPNNLPTSRFGFVVSLKVSKRAVVRNRVKRVLRKVVLDLLEKTCSGYDVLFLTKSSIQETNETEISRQVESLFLQAKILK